METKFCRDCGLRLSLGAFHAYSTGGTKPNCKECFNKARSAKRKETTAMPALSIGAHSNRGPNRDPAGNTRIVDGIRLNPQILRRLDRLGSELRDRGYWSQQSISEVILGASAGDLAAMAPSSQLGDCGRIAKAAIERGGPDEVLTALFRSVAAPPPLSRSPVTDRPVLLNLDILTDNEVVDLALNGQVGPLDEESDETAHFTIDAPAAPMAIATVDDAVAVAELVVQASEKIKELETEIPLIRADYDARIADLVAERDATLVGADQELVEARAELAEAAKMMGVRG